MIVWTAGLLFLLSGAAGLMYELVWFRMLATTFGATGPALAATTAAFMGGLGLGSGLAGRYADNLRRPFLAYAVLELGVAVFGPSMPYLMGAAEEVLGMLHPQPDASFARTTLLFTLNFSLLLLPAGFMGATLPILCRGLIRTQADIGRRFAWLYGINTIGAALGCALVGFVTVSAVGVSGTVTIAFGLNLVAAGGGWWLSGRISRAEASDLTEVKAEPEELSANPPAGPTDISATKVSLVVLATGFVSMAAQHQWARGLIFGFDRLKNTTYSFSAVLTVTLLGLVIGTVLASVLLRKRHLTKFWYAATTFLLALAIAGSGLLLPLLPPLSDTVDPTSLSVDFPAAVRNVFARVAVVLGPAAVLMGAAMPLAVELVVKSTTAGRSIGRLYAVSTLGAVVGSLSGPWLLTPLFGLVGGLVVAGGVLLAAGGLLLSPRSGQWLALGVGGAITTGTLFLPSSWTALQTLRPGEELLRYKDGTAATVAVIESASGYRRICVDDVPVAGTSPVMQTDQKSLAHWGMLLADDPRRALTVGFGSGGASWSFLLHDRLEHLDCVEICPDVPRQADLLTDANHGLLALSDPRYRIRFADARAFLRQTSEPYDVIVSDCTDLRYRSSANLYDYEYFTLCRDAMTEGGVTVIWMPLGGLSPDAFRMTLRTFDAVFSQSLVFYLHNQWTHYVLLVGRTTPLALDPAKARSLLSEADVAEDLSEIGMTLPEKICATYLTSGAELKGWLEGDELNTEDRPRLEFAVPRHDMGPWSAQMNLNELRKRRGSLEKVTAADVSLAAREKLSFFSAAAGLLLAAQEAERDSDIPRAARLYVDALAKTPEDDAIRRALEFPQLRELAETGQPTAWLFLGRARFLAGDLDEAGRCFRKFYDTLETLRGDTGAVSDDATAARITQAEAWKPTAANWQRELRESLP